ncbi:17699_t:CDS:10 [Funneliformis geosporum]|nr:17699_t:CDS:10 [Funneliformis geosporum]
MSSNDTSLIKGVLGKRTFAENAETEDINSHNQMHPRNRYKDKPPDFSVLAFKYSSFYPFVHYSKEGKPYIDYKNPEAVRELTYCLLRDDFNLVLDIPLDTLCPPIPSRLNYIHWIEDLVSSTESHEDLDQNTIYGIDIGTGASCIYPLLGCTLNKNWAFLATGNTDIDKKAVTYAKENVLRNNLDERITVHQNKTDKKILMSESMIRDSTLKFSFCMCNPPFYESQEQYERGLENKKASPHSVCTGSSNEMFTPGGEFQFIKDILEESLTLRTKIRWYTSKMGCLETVNKVVRELRKSGIDNYVITEFCQGHTRRWGIGWSFGSQRPTSSVSQPTSKKLRKSAPPKNEFSVVLSANIEDLLEFLQQLFDELEINGQWNGEANTFYGIVQINTWSRAARRAKHFKPDVKETPIMWKAPENENLFEFTCNIEPWDVSSSNTRVTVSWTNGKDRNIFESFYSHIKKRLEQEFSADE